MTWEQMWEELEQEYEEEKEYMSCFGEYYDEFGGVCEDGSHGLCPYCMECQRECVYY